MSYVDYRYENIKKQTPGKRCYLYAGSHLVPDY